MRLLNTPVATVALLLFATAACKKAESPPADPAAAPATPPAAPAAPVTVSSLDLGRAIGPDKRVTTSMSEFGTRDTIYVSVVTTGVSAGTPMTAKWTFQGNETVTLDSTTLSLAPTGPAVTEFHIRNTSAWPTGRYKVAILLHGTPAMEKEFEVKK